MLALPLSDALLGEDGHLFLSSFTLNEEYKRTIENAGWFFDAWYKEKIMGVQKEKIEEEEEEQKAEEFNQDDINNFEKKRHKKKENDLSQLEENYYNILGLNELGMGASENQIKGAYRKLALVYHPDKASAENDTTAMWLKVQKAYETLIDPEKKKKYDSTLPFDDTIPEEPVPEAQFFETFKPVFIRNAFWSNKRPIPDLGDMNTDIKKVERFYAFWENFDSWRDFSVFDEYNLDEAENRYERRYMEKENKKIKANHLKAERQRINKLVNNARENDPRLIKIRKEEEEKREKARLEKQMKKDQYKKEREERERREEEAKLAKIREKEEEEKREQDEKKRKITEARTAIKDLKTVFAEKIDNPEYDKYWLESFMEKLKHTDIVEFGSLLKSATKESAFDILMTFIEKFDKTHAKRTQDLIKKDKQAEIARREEEKKKRDAEWTLDELSLLAKGLVKYPVGSKNRWATIAAYLGTKSSDDVLAKAKEQSNAQAMKANSEKATKEAFLSVQKTGMKTIDAEPDQRAVYDQREIQRDKTAPAPKEEKKVPEKPAPKENGSTTPKDAAPQEEWSQEQQKQLELALREFPASMDANERWTKIAEKVGGKTKKQCVDRFKQLRDAIKKAPVAK